MKILFCAYRNWAENVLFHISPILGYNSLTLVRTPEELEKRTASEEWDVIVLVGWSWKVPAEIVDSRLVIGMHPSDLPMYAGGSPIQNQILDGIEQTNATLFKLSEKFDDGEIIDKEPIDLTGHLVQVFDNITKATSNLILRFVKNFPNNTYTKQTGERHVVRRLKPEHSKLPLPDNGNGNMTCKELWDFIRCREDPYPNAYFEDDTGRLIIKRVEFIPK